MKRRSSRLQQNEHTATLRRSSRVRRCVVVSSYASESSEHEEQVPRKSSTGSCNNRKEEMSVEAEQEQQLPVITSVDGVPVVELPSSPEEEKPKPDLLFLIRPALEPEDRQRLLDAASVFKSSLVAHLKSSEDNLSTRNMKILASECYNVLDILGDDYTLFHSEVKKLIAQHQKLESAAKDKENWDEWEIKARYINQVQSLSEVAQKLSNAQKELSEAKNNLDYLMFKKEELTDELRMITEKLCKEEERVKSLKGERDQFQNTHSDIEVGLVELEAENKEASVAFEAYNVAKEEFTRMTDHLLQLVKK